MKAGGWRKVLPQDATPNAMNLKFVSVVPGGQWRRPIHHGKVESDRKVDEAVSPLLVGYRPPLAECDTLSWAPLTNAPTHAPEPLLALQSRCGREGVPTLD